MIATLSEKSLTIPIINSINNWFPVFNCKVHSYCIGCMSFLILFIFIFCKHLCNFFFFFGSSKVWQTMVWHNLIVYCYLESISRTVFLELISTIFNQQKEESKILWLINRSCKKRAFSHVILNVTFISICTYESQI